MPEILHSYDFSDNSAENQRGKYGLIDHVFLGLQQVGDKQGFSMDRYASQLDMLLDSNMESLDEDGSNSLEEVDKGNQFECCDSDFSGDEEEEIMEEESFHPDSVKYLGDNKFRINNCRVAQLDHQDQKVEKTVKVFPVHALSTLVSLALQGDSEESEEEEEIDEMDIIKERIDEGYSFEEAADFDSNLQHSMSEFEFPEINCAAGLSGGSNGQSAKQSNSSGSSQSSIQGETLVKNDDQEGMEESEEKSEEDQKGDNHLSGKGFNMKHLINSAHMTEAYRYLFPSKGKAYSRVEGKVQAGKFKWSAALLDHFLVSGNVLSEKLLIGAGIDNRQELIFSDHFPCLLSLDLTKYKFSQVEFYDAQKRHEPNWRFLNSMVTQSLAHKSKNCPVPEFIARPVDAFVEEMNKEQGLFLVALEDIKKLTETFTVQKEASVEMRKEIDELTLRFHDVCTEAAFKAEKAVSVRDRIKSILSMSGKDKKETVEKNGRNGEWIV